MIFHLFTLMLFVLKLTAVIDWSWWLVFAPTIVAVAVPLVIFICAMILITRSK